MPRLSQNQVPSYRLHKQSGQAVVTLDGRDLCLGKFGSPNSKTEYNRLLAEWLSNGRSLPAEAQAVTVLEVADAFLTHARVYYCLPDGTPSGEIDNYRRAMRPLLKIYETTAADEFSPLCLKAVRQKMIEMGWCRRHINDQVARLKHMFKWAVENELVPPSIYHGLIAVAGLKAGRCEARESKPVTPAPDEQVDAVLQHTSRQVAAMIRLQLLTGMRPGEVCAMRGIDIDATGALWLYRPQRHKTAHHGHSRIVYLGPQAQEIVRPFLRPNLTEHLFSPAESEQERRQAMHARRKTPLSCGNKPGTKRSARPRRRPTDHYTRGSYAGAIAYACNKAFRPPVEFARHKDETLLLWRKRLTPLQRAALLQWQRQHRFHPHQLRHTAATRLRREFGLEAAQVILGHKTLTITQVYAEKNVEAAAKIMAQVG